MILHEPIINEDDMNNTKHTPGPWYTNPKAESIQGLIYEESTGKNVAVSYDPKDAHLIAAAPDLLAAAEQAINCLYPYDAATAKAIDMLRDAIENATQSLG